VSCQHSADRDARLDGRRGRPGQLGRHVLSVEKQLPRAVAMPSALILHSKTLRVGFYLAERGIARATEQPVVPALPGDPVAFAAAVWELASNQKAR
jgi:hypothetical protein